MMRWRTIGRVGVWTTDRRRVVSFDDVKQQAVRPWVRLVLDGDVKGEYRVRLNGDRIEARLPWRYRDVTPAFAFALHDFIEEPFSIEWHEAWVMGLGPGPSAWHKADLA